MYEHDKGRAAGDGAVLANGTCYNDGFKHEGRLQHWKGMVASKWGHHPPGK